MISVTIANVISPRSGVVRRLRAILEGKTYMKFRINVCPVGGSFDVNAETDHDTSYRTVCEFILQVLASKV